VTELPGAPECPTCSKHKKVAKDYSELNAELLDRNRQLSFRLREIRRLLSPFTKALSEMSERANPN